MKKIAALIASCAAAAAFAVPATLSLTPPADNAVAATATSAVDYPIVLKEGMRGKDVTALQLMLRYSSPDLKVDGVFGADTKAAVIAKQKAAGIAADGVAGDDTLNALMVKVRSGDRSLATAATQTLLNKHGASIEVDGVAGTATMGAIKEFQSKKGLQVDGVVGPNTWSALYGEPQSDSAPVPNERAQVAEYAKKFVNGDAIPAKTLEGGVTTQPWKGGVIPTRGAVDTPRASARPSATVTRGARTTGVSQRSASASTAPASLAGPTLSPTARTCSAPARRSTRPRRARSSSAANCSPVMRCSTETPPTPSTTWPSTSVMERSHTPTARSTTQRLTRSMTLQVATRTSVATDPA